MGHPKGLGGPGGPGGSKGSKGHSWWLPEGMTYPRAFSPSSGHPSGHWGLSGVFGAFWVSVVAMAIGL